MSYIQKTMSAAEQSLIQVRPSLRPLAVQCILFTILTLGAGSFLAIPYFYIRKILNLFNEIGVTTRRLVTKRGVISYLTDEYLLRQIESVQVQQSFFGRMFGWGTVLVHGTGGDPMRCLVSHPHVLRQVIDEAIEMSLSRR